MKKLMNMILGVFMACACMGAFATELLGPSGHYLEADLGVYGNTAKNSDEKNTNGMTVMGSAFWTEPASFDVGFEALAADFGHGGFASGRIPTSDNLDVVAGVGVLGYKVDTAFGDYYAKEPALMLRLGYQTKFGRLVAGYIITESDKNHYTAMTGETCSKPHKHSEPVCSKSTNVAKRQTENTKTVFQLGIQKHWY